MIQRKGKTIRGRLQTSDYQGLGGKVGKEGGNKLTIKEYEETIWDGRNIQYFACDGSYSTVFACQHS